MRGWSTSSKPSMAWLRLYSLPFSRSCTATVRDALDEADYEGRAAGQRDAADPRGCGREGAQRAGEVLHVMPRRHVAGVACFQLVVQALHQLILGSGGDYLHACLYTRILTRTAKEKLFLQCLRCCRHWRNSVFVAQNRAKSY